MAKVRLDDLLIEQGYFPNRDAVVRAVIAKEAISSQDISRAHTTRRAPRRYHIKAAAAFETEACVDT